MLLLSSRENRNKCRILFCDRSVSTSTDFCALQLSVSVIIHAIFRAGNGIAGVRLGPM